MSAMSLTTGSGGTSGLWLNMYQQVRAEFQQYRIAMPFRVSMRHLWEGLSVPTTKPVDIFANKNIIQGYYPYVESKKDRVRLGEITSAGQLKNPNHIKAWTVLQNMTRTFEYWPVTFTFEDVLGHGGMGLVLKFNELTKDKDVVRSVAVKRALTEQAEKSLREEGEIMKNFIGAEHLVQLIPEPDPNAKPDPNEPPALKPNGSRKHPRDPDDDVDMNDRPARRPRVEIDSPMLVMEYLKNGNLADIIQRVRERKDVYVPDRILWKFFLCLIKACIELANPPCDTRKVKTQPRQLVHFDIDPQNVLVDDFTKIPGEHDVSPRLKIGDFGLTESMERGANNEYGWFSHYRGRGKYGYFSPEQFTVEWDPIPPDAEDFPHETAGNYGSHTNVWGIGLVMESLITTYYPLDPPRATMLRFANVDYASYGAHLLDAQFDDIDPPLRRLVTCCLAHNPMHRPPLDELQRLAEQRGQNIPGDDWTDDELEAWTTLILYEPPSSTASTPTPTPAPQPSRSRGFKAINI